MLPQKNKLTVNLFNRLTPKPNIFKNNSFTLVVKKIDNSESPRFCITVPKYLDKRSTRRHSTKRIIEEIIRPKISQINPTLYILIKAQRIFIKKNYKEAEKELLTLVNKIGLV